MAMKVIARSHLDGFSLYAGDASCAGSLEREIQTHSARLVSDRSSQDTPHRLQQAGLMLNRIRRLLASKIIVQGLVLKQIRKLSAQPANPNHMQTSRKTHAGGHERWDREDVFRERIHAALERVEAIEFGLDYVGHLSC